MRDRPDPRRSHSCDCTCSLASRVERGLYFLVPFTREVIVAVAPHADYAERGDDRARQNAEHVNRVNGYVGRALNVGAARPMDQVERDARKNVAETDRRLVRERYRREENSFLAFAG